MTMPIRSSANVLSSGGKLYDVFWTLHQDAAVEGIVYALSEGLKSEDVRCIL